ncbi:CLUMA_CG012680, isoform A [Clunio marinus]|uniref:Reticulon-like protein n=1 Tax=Clunio marinus TaxID=568069 RepID=A0A1J1IJJ9_9DIPT|nr:CLUMA_CG012680, isoform A [Clunio marinus]
MWLTQPIIRRNSANTKKLLPRSWVKIKIIFTQKNKTMESAENQDDLIIKQQREIEKEISDSFALISEELPVETLNNEYADDPIYTRKVQDIEKKYKYIRKVRPDGNCFFRAFAFAILEHLIKHQDEFIKFKKIAEESKSKLLQLNFPQFTIEDFYDTFIEVIHKVEPKDNQAQVLEELYKVFNEQGSSDYVVVYLRLITSGKLQEESDFYQNFIDGSYGSVAEFCHKEVEAMYKESDHIHIIAICAALGASVRVEYMDRGSEDAVVAHDFPDDGQPTVYLLYRPSHYDILYPNKRILKRKIEMENVNIITDENSPTTKTDDIANMKIVADNSSDERSEKTDAEKPKMEDDESTKLNGDSEPSDENHTESNGKVEENQPISDQSENIPNSDEAIKIPEEIKIESNDTPIETETKDVKEEVSNVAEGEQQEDKSEKEVEVEKEVEAPQPQIEDVKVSEEIPPVKEEDLKVVEEVAEPQVEFQNSEVADEQPKTENLNSETETPKVSEEVQQVVEDNSTPQLADVASESTETKVEDSETKQEDATVEDATKAEEESPVEVEVPQEEIVEESKKEDIQEVQQSEENIPQSNEVGDVEPVIERVEALQSESEVAKTPESPVDVQEIVQQPEDKLESDESILRDVEEDIIQSVNVTPRAAAVAAPKANLCPNDKKDEKLFSFGLDVWFKPDRLHPRAILIKETRKKEMGRRSTGRYQNSNGYSYQNDLPERGPEIFDIDLSLSSEKIQQSSGVFATHVNAYIGELRRLFCVEDIIDSVKFGLLLWVLTYIGAMFNGMTVIILTFVAIFTIPKIYEANKQKIDQGLDIVKEKYVELSESIVNERRLQNVFGTKITNILNAIDVGNNKKALQEVEKVLKKTSKLRTALALKALALIRLGREKESQMLIEDLERTEPDDDSTLQVLTYCYRELDQLNKICLIYHNAAKKLPNNEEILSQLFMAHVRVNDYKSQQIVALQLFKAKPKNPYYFWAVMSIILQALRGPESSEKEKSKILLLLAQRMESFEEMLTFLTSEVCSEHFPGVPISIKIELLKKLKNWMELKKIVEELLIEDPDRWDYYKDYIFACFELIKSGDSNTSPESCFNFMSKKDQLQRHICSLQISRLCGSHSSLSVEHLQALYSALSLHYEHSFSAFDKNLLPTDIGLSDQYALLAAHVMFDLAAKENSIERLIEAAHLLNYLLQNSPSNFHAKLLCLQIYHILGCSLGAHSIYSSLDVKHVQLDSLGYLHCTHLPLTGIVSLAKPIYDQTLKFFTASYKESLEYLAMSYKFGSFSKLQEFMDFPSVDLIHSPMKSKDDETKDQNDQTSTCCPEETYKTLMNSWEDLFTFAKMLNSHPLSPEYLVNLLPSRIHFMTQLPYEKVFRSLAQFVYHLWIGTEKTKDSTTDLISSLGDVKNEIEKLEKVTGSGPIFSYRNLLGKFVGCVEILSLCSFVMSNCYEKCHQNLSQTSKKKRQQNNGKYSTNLSGDEKVSLTVEVMRELRNILSLSESSLDKLKPVKVEKTLDEYLATLSINRKPTSHKTESPATCVITMIDIDVHTVFEDSYQQTAKELSTLIKDKLKMIYVK